MESPAEHIMVTKVDPRTFNQMQAPPTPQHRQPPATTVLTSRRPLVTSLLTKAALATGRGAFAALSSLATETIRGFAELRSQRATLADVARNVVRRGAAVGAGPSSALIAAASTFVIATAAPATTPFMRFVGVGLGTYDVIGTAMGMWRAGGWEVWSATIPSAIGGTVLSAASPKGDLPAGPAGEPSAGLASSSSSSSAGKGVGSGVASSVLVGRGRRGPNKTATSPGAAKQHTKGGARPLVQRVHRPAAAAGAACNGAGLRQLLKQEVQRAAQEHLLRRRKGRCGGDCQKAGAKAPRKFFFHRQQM